MSDIKKFFPPAAFFFSVIINGDDSGADAYFQEVSGLEMELEVEDVVEGGQNGFKHRLPTRAKYNNLILKRGLILEGSNMLSWCQNTIQKVFQKAIELKSIAVQLQDSAGNPLMTWNFNNAYPIKWKVSDFNAEENAIVIENLEFAYRDFSVS